ncbi:CPCC family cysteine-rich protein [Streptomyces sp. NPDC088915]|uniref:CPCC family cysteine-rich protein n=1 Tax=Streptomyces sp. NPDC088915 TaxID=3365912 RepID=UPI0037FB917E
MSDRYPCPRPCCGHRVLSTMPGSYEIRSVCFREGDGARFRWPTMPGGANKVSLIEVRHTYQDFDACDEHGRRYGRPPTEDKPLAAEPFLAQVILHSQFRRVDTGRTCGISGPAPAWELDWTAPWGHLVEESRSWSLLEASEAPTDDNVFVAPTWIDRADLHPER